MKQCAELIQLRTSLHTEFRKGWMIDEKSFIDSNLEHLKSAYEAYQLDNDPSYLNFIIETSEMVYEKLKGTVFTLGFFKARSPQMRELDEYAQCASATLQRAFQSL